MKTKTNEQFMLLSVIGIIIVVLCHLPGQEFEFIKTFPFITLFVFVSGYFYKEEKEENVWKYILYKFKKLIIPFLIINFIYGLIINSLNHFNIVHYGKDITLYTVLIQPFTNNNQFIFNFPAYFVPAIFFTNSLYVIIRKLLKNVKKFKEELLFIIFIILHILSIHFQSVASDYNFKVIVLRVMFFLPFFQFGYLYKKKLQKYDEKIPTIPYLIILAVINVYFYKTLGNLNYDMHEFVSFQSKYLVIPLITSIISILFYSRIAKVLSKWVGKNKLINYISNNTFSIMTHHIFIFFLISWILYTINLNIKIPYFDVERFKAGWTYIYEIPNFKWLFQTIYAILAITGSLGIHYIYEKIKKRIGE